MNSVGEVIGIGRTAELFTYGDDYVLKLFKVGIPTHLVEREFSISLSVYHSGASIPKPIEMIRHDNGRTGIVYERAVGATMLHIIMKKPWTLNGITKRMAQIHGDIHRKVVSDLPGQKDLLKTNIYEAPLLTAGEKECIINHLDNLKEGNRLCHGDFHPDNIILGIKDVTLDWMTGMTGNPAGDVARTTLLLKMGSMPEAMPKIAAYVVSKMRNQLLKKYLQHYKATSAIKSKEMEDWILPVAAARLNEWIPEQEKQALVQLIRQRLIVNSTKGDVHIGEKYI